MPTFMDRNPELRDLIEKTDIHGSQFAEYTNKTFRVYETYSKGLPDDSAWKTGKVEHVTHGSKTVHELASRFGIRDAEVDVITYPLVAHDTGRLVHEHIQRGSGQMPPWRHGIESMLFAEQIFGAFAETELGQAILLAIKHHSDVTTPSIEKLGGSKAAFALTGLVRDFDKLTGFDDAALYTADETFKRNSILTNFSTQRRTDPTWGDEKGKIVPETMLDTFIAGKALVRRDCQSYEAYMAQFLAWLFDIQNDEVLEICVEKGGPKIVLNYILAQLKTGAPEQYAILRDWAEKWRGGVLLAS